jgi:uncharacterized protein YkwD
MRALPLAAAVLALLPALAHAETRYATPNPAAEADCTQGNPCAVMAAIEMAQADVDDVQLAAGDYGPVSNSKAIVIHGAPGTRPRIIGAGNPAAILTGGTLADVEVVQTTATDHAIEAANAVVQRVVARSTGMQGVALYLRDGAVVRSSAAFAPGDGGRAISVYEAPGGVVLHGVTATAAADALFVEAAVSNDARVTATNTILRGGDSDVEMVTAGGDATATLDHSAYRPAAVVGIGLTNAGDNITADPVLAADGIHQAVTSPTLNAGVADANTPKDIDGEARSQGPAPDIGADERAPEPVVEPTPSPTAVPTVAPTATPIPAPQALPFDTTLPGFISVKFAKPPVAGQLTDLVVEVLDPDSPILGLIIDLGPLGYIGHTACRTLAPSGAFVAGESQKFTIPVVFNTPGLQTYALEIRSGGCTGAQQSSRTELSTLVGSGALIARGRIAQTAPVSCAGSARPTPAGVRRLASAVVCLMNAERKKLGLKPLKVNRKLTKSAKAHTNDMLSKKYYNHQRPGGPTLGSRIRKARYRGGAGENLGLASSTLATPAAMMKAWMGSPMHKANILQRRFRAVGVYVQARDPLGRMRGAAIYTVNFGTR